MRLRLLTSIAVAAFTGCAVKRGLPEPVSWAGRFAHYPGMSATACIEGVQRVRISVDEDGRVTDAVCVGFSGNIRERVVKADVGMPLFCDWAVKATADWRYPAAGRERREAVVEFVYELVTEARAAGEMASRWISPTRVRFRAYATPACTDE
jgi:hypothetical protein